MRFHRVLKVGLQIADEAKRKFEDVRGRRGAAWAKPAVAMEGYGGFLLRTGEGKAEVRVVDLSEEARAEAAALIVCSAPDSSRGVPLTSSKPVGFSSSGSNCTAPTQSRPMAVRGSNASVEPVAKRA